MGTSISVRAAIPRLVDNPFGACLLLFKAVRKCVCCFTIAVPFLYMLPKTIIRKIISYLAKMSRRGRMYSIKNLSDGINNGPDYVVILPTVIIHSYQMLLPMIRRITMLD